MLVAIDGAFFDGSVSKVSIVTRARLEERLAKLDSAIAATASEVTAAESETAAYVAMLDANDATETQAAAAAQPGEAVAASDRAALPARRRWRRISRGWRRAGRRSSRAPIPMRGCSPRPAQSVSGYNVQIAVDSAHNDGNDTGQLHALAQAARSAMGVEAAADCGHYNGEALKACEENGIEAFVPEPNPRQAAGAGGPVRSRGLRLRRQPASVISAPGRGSGRN